MLHRAGTHTFARAWLAAALLAALCTAPIRTARAQAPVASTAHRVPDSMAQRALACTGCHGEQGRAQAEGYVPRLAGKPAGYLLAQLQAFRDGRRRQQTMGALLQALDNEMLAALATHFASLSLPYPPPTGAALPAADARRARELVEQGDTARRIPACQACHGQRLTGVAPHVPGLLGLPADYLIGQIGAWRTGHRHARTPDCMGDVARRLPAADISRVARWLAVQPVPNDASAAAAPPGRWPLECAGQHEATPQVASASTSTAPAVAAQVARGAYLARVGNCAGCHTAPGGPALAGAVRLTTPWGDVFAGNLTPDAATGLGRWSADDFHRAMHEGRGRDGRDLVPVFPYTSFTHVARDDNDALFAYLRSLPPVSRARPAHTLRFPYGTPTVLALWRGLNFRPAAALAQAPTGGLARGAYLVRGLGHCGECHAPRNATGAMTESLSGAEMPSEPWYAPSLQPAPGPAGDTRQTVTLLREGRNAHGVASGPMARVVLDSTQHWQAQDLELAARYLHSLTPRAAAPAAPAGDPALLRTGAALYANRCADCHGRDGAGVPGIYPPLAGNPGVTQASIRNLVQVLAHGGFAASTAANPRPYGMPPAELSDTQTAAVLSFIRQAFGHRAATVSPLDVARAR